MDGTPTSMARTIENARRRTTLLPPFTAQQPDLALDTAYEVAAAASALRCGDTGAVAVGRKIGFTNRTIWDRYGVHAPIWGWMYDDTVADAVSGRATVGLAALVQPRVEPEIVFGLGSAVDAGDDVATIARNIEWVAFGFEVVHCHYPDWRFTIVDTVIDGSLHGASRIGPRQLPWRNMIDDLAEFRLRLLRNGSVIDEGRGANVLDSPLHAVAHLARVAGRIGAGEILTTGTITDAAPALPGETYGVEIDGLPLEAIELRLV